MPKPAEIYIHVGLQSNHVDSAQANRTTQAQTDNDGVDERKEPTETTHRNGEQHTQKKANREDKILCCSLLFALIVI